MREFTRSSMHAHDFLQRNRNESMDEENVTQRRVPRS
jgi:hypothetical protein